MTNSDIDNFDREVQRAWIAFRDQLADRIAAMSDDDLLVVESGFEDADLSPCAQFLGWGGVVRCEVPSNPYLRKDRWLRDEDVAMLLDLGFHQPNPGPLGSPAYFVDLDSSRADQLATLAVSALRDVWDVPHPSFLTVTVNAESVSEPAPFDPEHLRTLIGRTLTTEGVDYVIDDDGDFNVYFGKLVMFVVISEDSPEIEMWAMFQHNGHDPDRTAELVAELKRDWQVPLFIMRKMIRAVAVMPAEPFESGHFVEELERFHRFMLSADDAFGRRRPSTRDSTFPPGLLAILDLDPDGLGLDPAVISLACNDSRQTVAEYVHICTEQVVAWRNSALAARQRGKVDDEHTFTHEADAWERTAESLSTALRLLTKPVHRHRQLELFSNPVEPTLFDEPL